MKVVAVLYPGGSAGDVCKAGTIGVIGVCAPQAMTFPIGALQQRNLTVGSRSNRSPKRIEEE